MLGKNQGRHALKSVVPPTGRKYDGPNVFLFSQEMEHPVRNGSLPMYSVNIPSLFSVCICVFALLCTVKQQDLYVVCTYVKTECA